MRVSLESYLAQGSRLKAEGKSCYFQPPASSLQPPASTRGFTLVELLVVLMILMVVGAALLTTLMTGRTSYLSADAYVQVQQEARKAFDNVVRELRESGNISCGTDVPPKECATNNAQLNFQIATGYSGGAIQWGSDTACSAANPANIYLHYAMMNVGGIDRLVRVCNTSSTTVAAVDVAPCTPPVCRVLANNVNLNLARSGFIAIDTPSDTEATNPDQITVNLEVLYTNNALPGRSQSSGQLTSQVRLRNSY